MADVAQKGTSNQYMIGEKFLRVDKYQPPACPSCSDGGDNENMYTGYNNDVNRTTFYMPSQDQRPPFRFPDAAQKGNNETLRFGAPTRRVQHDDVRRLGPLHQILDQREPVPPGWQPHEHRRGAVHQLTGPARNVPLRRRPPQRAQHDVLRGHKGDMHVFPLE
jgi:hypothetical protein